VATVLEHELVLDCKNLLCPMPIIKLNAAISQIGVGHTLQMDATDPGSQYDVQAWAKQTHHELVSSEKNGKVFTYVVRRTH
jgi:tRNA 2-thiouridine synthesizing protein A